MWETWVQSLGGEDPLEEGMATHSSILAWRIPTDKEKPGGLQSMGLQSDTTSDKARRQGLVWEAEGGSSLRSSFGFLCSLASSARCSLAPSWPLHTLLRAPALCWLKTVRAKAEPEKPVLEDWAR